MGLPNIDIIFSAIARTAIARSQKGIATVVVKDDTDTNFTNKQYSFLADLTADESKYTSENYRLLRETFLGTPNKVVVVRIGTGENMSSAKSDLDMLNYDWVGVIDKTMQDDLVSYVKSRNLIKIKQVKAISYKGTTTDNIHVVDFVNDKIKRKSQTAEEDGNTFIPRLLGILAGLPFTRTSTFYKFDDLEYVSEISDLNTQINNGKFCLFNDEGIVRVARGVNSLNTVTQTETEDMKKISIVEAMDMIKYDIYDSFKNNMVGKYKNSYDNQIVFISAVNSYFEQLETESVLDNRYQNIAQVDVSEQRKQWIDSGKPEAVDWDEYTVKENTFRSNMFLEGDIKILDAIEDLKFNIEITV